MRKFRRIAPTYYIYLDFKKFEDFLKIPLFFSDFDVYLFLSDRKAPNVRGAIFNNTI